MNTRNLIIPAIILFFLSCSNTVYEPIEEIEENSEIETFTTFLPCELLSNEEITTTLNIDPDQTCPATTYNDAQFKLCLRCIETTNGDDYIFDIFLDQNEDPSAESLNISNFKYPGIDSQQSIDNLGEEANLYVINDLYRAIAVKEKNYLFGIIFQIDNASQEQIRQDMIKLCELIIAKF